MQMASHLLQSAAGAAARERAKAFTLLSLFIAARGAINLHPCALLVRGRKAPCAWTTSPETHLSAGCALWQLESPTLSPPKLVVWLLAATTRTRKKFPQSREMLVVIDRGERCKFDAAGSARAPMLFWKALRERERAAVSGCGSNLEGEECWRCARIEVID